MESDNFWNIMLENPGNDNSWITLVLEGTTSNKSAIGATIMIVAVNDKGEERTIFRQVSPGGSFGSSSLQQEIGLGTFSTIKSITVRWPSSNTEQLFEDEDENRVYKITEGKGKLKLLKRKHLPFKGSDGDHHHQH